MVGEGEVKGIDWVVMRKGGGLVSDVIEKYNKDNGVVSVFVLWR